MQISVWAGPCRKRAGSSAHFYPKLVTSALHYGYALVMLAGLWLLRSGFTGTRDRQWWTIALGFSSFTISNTCCVQVIFEVNLFGRPVPDQHRAALGTARRGSTLFYNTIVFIRWRSRCITTCFLRLWTTWIMQAGLQPANHPASTVV